MHASKKSLRIASLLGLLVLISTLGIAAKTAGSDSIYTRLERDGGLHGLPRRGKRAGTLFVNTAPLREACATCHSEDDQFAVSLVHAR